MLSLLLPPCPQKCALSWAGAANTTAQLQADVGKPEPQLVPNQGNPQRRQEASELNPFPLLLHCQRRNETV